MSQQRPQAPKPRLPSNQSYICHVDEDQEASRLINDRVFTNFNPRSSLGAQADASSQLLNLTGYRNYNSRYCPTPQQPRGPQNLRGPRQVRR